MNTETRLAPYAASARTSRGRCYPEPPAAPRGEYQRDRDRVIHCAAFRRLEYKTQVFVNHEGDLFRTRLTHSIEVAQIGRSIARALNLNEDLTEAIALVHDLGHTPFGHTGQEALNECMRDHGGFEHNLQSLRVIDVIEERYAEFPGLNLTFETREGVLKHCSAKNARQLGDVGRRFLERTQPGLEAQLVNLADEIAYNNHDVDDGLRSGLLTIEQLREIALFAEQHDVVLHHYPDLAPRRAVHETIRRMIDRVVTDVTAASAARIAAAGAASIDDVRRYPDPLIGYSDAVLCSAQALKRFLREHLYAHERVREMSARAAHTVRALYAVFHADPGRLPVQYRERLATSGDSAPRVIADYIAGMTDRYAIREHARLCDPSLWLATDAAVGVGLKPAPTPFL